MDNDRTRWTARYGADYQTDVERRQAFAEYLRARTEMAAIFGKREPMSTERVNRAGDDRCAVADALTTFGADFAYQSGGLVKAIAHDGVSLVVSRSPLIATDTSRPYRPVADYIEQHGLELADRRTFNLPAPDCSLIELSWWTRHSAQDGPSPLVELEAEMTR